MESSCCPFHVSRLSHCLLQSNRQRQSPRRYEYTPSPLGVPYFVTLNRKQNMFHRYTFGCDISHPGHLPLPCSRLQYRNLRDSDTSRTGRKVNALNMSLILHSQPIPIGASILYRFPHTVSAWVRFKIILVSYI